jgi:predicted transcriptional regulator
MNDFKPAKKEKTVTSIRIDTDMLKTIDDLANDTDISRNEMIVQCIDYALKNFSHQKNDL